MQVTASQWCYQKWEEAIEAGDEVTASHYMQLYEDWKAKGM